MDIINAYKEDYIDTVKDIRSKLNLVDLSQNLIERDRLLNEIKNSISECERLLRSMKLSKSTDGEALNMMIDTFRGDLRSLSAEYEEKDREVQNSNRSKLINANTEDEEFSQSRRQTMKMIKTTEVIKDANDTATNTILLSQDIIVDLERQIRVVDRSLLTLEGMHDSLDEAGLIMTKIWAKMLTTQGIRLLIVLILIVSNISIIYMRFFWSPSKPKPPLNDTAV